MVERVETHYRLFPYSYVELTKTTPFSFLRRGTILKHCVARLDQFSLSSLLWNSSCLSNSWIFTNSFSTSFHTSVNSSMNSIFYFQVISVCDSLQSPGFGGRYCPKFTMQAQHAINASQAVWRIAMPMYVCMINSTSAQKLNRMSGMIRDIQWLIYDSSYPFCHSATDSHCAANRRNALASPAAYAL